MTHDRYGPDALSHTPHTPTAAPHVPAEHGLVVEDVDTGWVGAIIRVSKDAGGKLVVLEDRHGRTRSFPLGPGFWVDGRPVVLITPTQQVTQKKTRTASGSTFVAEHRAEVAHGSRIWVEGKHDAELVEKIWGDDLRVEGIVVEMLDGVDHLEERLVSFSPSPERKVGVLVDHLVSGAKETRIATAIEARFGRYVKVVGHPYVDIWQAVKPGRVGLTAWPRIDRQVEWKAGILAALGKPHATQPDIAAGWAWLLGRVRDFRDVEAELLGRVEELIDYVTSCP